MTDVLITPLKKRKLNGDLYTRDPKVEALLVELESLSRDELVARARISVRSDPYYAPNECILYFVRASRAENSDAWFERLYRILAERVLRSLPRSESGHGNTDSMTQEAIRDKVFGQFVEMLASDRRQYCEKLDYFEVRFDGALANLRRDAQRQVWRDEKRSAPLEYEEDSGEPSAEVEEAAGQFDPFDAAEADDEAFRSRLAAAIDLLPPEQRRIVELLRLGFPITSKEAGTMTIAKALDRSEKTVRTYRDRAFVALRAALSEDGEA